MSTALREMSHIDLGLNIESIHTMMMAKTIRFFSHSPCNRDRKKSDFSRANKGTACVPIFHHLSFLFRIFFIVPWSSSLYCSCRPVPNAFDSSKFVSITFFSSRCEHTKKSEISRNYMAVSMERGRNVATRNNCLHLIYLSVKYREQANWWGCYWNLLLLSKSKSL